MKIMDHVVDKFISSIKLEILWCQIFIIELVQPNYLLLCTILLALVILRALINALIFGRLCYIFDWLVYFILATRLHT